MNSWCINYNQYIQNKIKNKLHVKAINYACFKMVEKTTRKVKKNNNSINIIGDKFGMSRAFFSSLLRAIIVTAP